MRRYKFLLITIITTITIFLVPTLLEAQSVRSTTTRSYRSAGTSTKHYGGARHYGGRYHGGGWAVGGRYYGNGWAVGGVWYGGTRYYGGGGYYGYPARWNPGYYRGPTVGYVAPRTYNTYPVRYVQAPVQTVVVQDPSPRVLDEPKEEVSVIKIPEGSTIVVDGMVIKNVNGKIIIVQAEDGKQ